MLSGLGENLQNFKLQCCDIHLYTQEKRNTCDSLTLSEDDKKDQTVIVAATLERHKFNTRFQEDGECFDDFSTEIKLLSRIVIKLNVLIVCSETGLLGALEMTKLEKNY